MGILIQRYKKGSQSGNMLINELKKIIGHITPIYRYAPKASIKINCGSSRTYPHTQIYLNHPEIVKKCINKIYTFEQLSTQGVPIPEWTTHKEKAKKWLNEGKKVICRTLPSASKGKGIVLAANTEELVDAPLYTLYIPKRKEYRIIMFRNTPIAFMRKILKKEFENDGHSSIRNAERYAFCNIPNTAIKTKTVLEDLGQKVIKTMGLDFCAIDVIKDLNTNKWYVLEVNTAFGLGENNARKLALEMVKFLSECNYLITQKRR